MRFFPSPLKDLVKNLSAFPGVGEKSALRMALFLLKREEETAERIANSIVNARKEVRYCDICGSFSDDGPCGICADELRQKIICVVEEPQDILPVERSGEFGGKYHVLGGAISPIDGVLPEDLSIESLVSRIKREGIEEVVIATNLNVEGEATAAYISSMLKPMGVKVTRIAYGMPIGADLEYADEFTVGKAIAFRREM